MNPAETPPPLEPSGPFWAKFFVGLLGPAVVTTVAAALGIGPIVLLGLGVSFLSPFACAWVLAQRLRGPHLSFALTFLGLVVLLLPLSVGLCFGGCVLGVRRVH